MKRILIITIFILTSASYGFAQNNPRIKALKTAFITNSLDLSSKEAQQFWPVYNKYERTIHLEKIIKMRQLTKKANDLGGMERLSDNEANAILKELIEIDFKVANAKKDLYNNLIGIIPPKKVIKLFKAEQDFNKELLKQLRDRRKEMIQNRN